MSILNSLITDYELKSLEEELHHYEEILQEYKVQLDEADDPLGFASHAAGQEDIGRIFDEATRRLQVAKKALGLANRLPTEKERRHHKGIVIGLLNKLRALITRLGRQLTQEVRSS